MRRGSLITILGSLVFAALVAWLGNAWIEKKYSVTAPPPEPRVQVLVAAKDIPIDTKIDPSYLKTLDLPAASAPEGHLTTPDQILGKRLKEPVYAGEIILGRRLSENTNSNVLAAILTPGMRAVALRVDELIGVSGFILPGSRVDVMAAGGGLGARTVLQDIKVLSVDQALTATGGTLPAKLINLEVDPRQAELLMEVTGSANIRLALRPPGDRDINPSGTVTQVKPMRTVTQIKGMSLTPAGQWEYSPNPGAPNEVTP